MTRSISGGASENVALRRGFNFVDVCALIFLTGFSATASAQSTAWIDGETLARYWNAPIAAVHWTGRPLREGLSHLGENIAAEGRLALVLDRRVDPGLRVDFTIEDHSLGETVELLAEQLRLGVARLGPVVYLGPEQSTRRLRTLAELRNDDVRALPPAARLRLGRAIASQWPELATPREILQNMAANAGLRIGGLERVPHDLWPDGALPPASLLTQVTLIANQFDLTFRVAADGESMELVPIEGPVALVRSYPLVGPPEPLLARLEAIAPDARFHVAENTLVATGRDEEHEIIRELLSGGSLSTGRPARPAGNSERPDSDPLAPAARFTLELENAALADVLVRLERSAGLSFAWQLGDGVDPGPFQARLISFHVRQLTLDELLEAILRPAGLTFTRDGAAVSLRLLEAP
jgi:hypothetical protein